MQRSVLLLVALVLVLAVHVAAAADSSRFSFSSDIVKVSKFTQSFSVENHASAPSFSGNAHQVAQVPFAATVSSAVAENGDSFLGVINIVDSGASSAVTCKPQDIRFYVNGDLGAIECPSQAILSPSHPFTCNVQFSSVAAISNDVELALEADLLCEDSSTTTIRTRVQTTASTSLLDGPLAAELRSDSAQISVVAPSDRPQTFPYTASAVCMDRDTNMTSLAFVCAPRRMLSHVQLQLVEQALPNVCRSSALAVDQRWEMTNQQSSFLELGDRSVRLEAAFQNPAGDHLQLDLHLQRSGTSSFCYASGLAKGFHGLAGAVFAVSLADDQCAEIHDEVGTSAILPLKFELIQLPSAPTLLPCFAALSGLSLRSQVTASLSDPFCSFVASSSASSALTCNADIVKQHSIHSRAVRTVPVTSQIVLTASLEHWFWRNYRWAVNNTVLPDAVYGFAGDSSTVGYTVDVTTENCDASLEVNGNITIKNTGSSAVEFTGYSATLLPDNTPIVLKCGAVIGNGASITIPAQGSLVCAVGATADNLTTRTIAVSVTTSVGSATGSFTAVKSSSPHSVLGESATLTNDDPNFLPSQHGTAELLAPGPYHFQFQHTITCPSNLDAYTHGRLQFYVNNTAHVLSNCGVLQNGTVRVHVSCYLPRFALEVSPEFTRAFNWTLVKTANVTSAIVPPGVPTVIGYTIRVSQTAQDSAYHVWGTASFFNYHPTATLTASYTVRLSTGQSVSLNDCSQSYIPSPGTLVISPGKSFDCHFDTPVSNPLPTSVSLSVTRNSITVTETENLVFTPSSDCVNACGRVTDKASLVTSTTTLAGFVAADQTVRAYTDSQTVPAMYCGPPSSTTVYNNASVLRLTGTCDANASVTTEVLASGSAVTVLTPNCTQLTASATFVATASSTCVWTVSKSASPTSVYMFANQSSPVTCSVNTTRTCTNKTSISATVTITNPSAYSATLASVVATLKPDGTQVNVLSVCPTVATIAAGASKQCTISFTVNAVDSTARTLQVEMTVPANSKVAVPFSPIQLPVPAPTLTVVGGTATLSESFLTTTRVLTDSTSFSYACQPIVCTPLAAPYGSSGTLSTTVNHNATLVPSNGGSLVATATVAAVCFRPSITTTSAGYKLSSYNWQCALTSPTTSIALSDFINAGVSLSYSVVVSTVAVTASGFVNGTITIKNPHTSSVLATTLSSSLVGTGTNPPVQITCSGASAANSIPVSVPVNSQLVCTFTATLGSTDLSKSISNSASFTLYGVTYSATSTSSTPAALSSTAATIYPADAFSVAGATAVVTNLSPSSLTASGAGYKYTYSLTRTAKGTTCLSSDTAVSETVSLFNSANTATRTAITQCSLDISVNCGTCTLSMGYWQTHSSYGPAFYDSTWARIGENNKFKNGPYTNYEIFYADQDAYSRLGSQYISTTLNVYKGSWLSADAYNALQAADALFNKYTMAQINSVYKSTATSLAATLATFTKDSCPP